MNKITKTMLLLIFIGIFFLFFNLQIKPSTTISLCQANLLTDIQIHNQDQESISIHKSNSENNWLISNSQQNVAAETDAIEAYKRFACYMPYVELFELPNETTESLKQKYGITEDHVVTVSGEHFSEKLYVGKMTPSGTEYYLYTTKNPNRIYTAANSYVDNLFPEIVGLMFRFPFLELANAKQVEIEFQGQQWVLLRDEKGFYFENTNLPRDLAQNFVANLYGTFFANYKNELTQIELANYQPELYDMLVSYTDQNTGKQQRWLFFKVNDSFTLLSSFGGEPFVLILDYVKMSNLENMLMQMTKF